MGQKDTLQEQHGKTATLKRPAKVQEENVNRWHTPEEDRSDDEDYPEKGNEPRILLQRLPKETRFAPEQNRTNASGCQSIHVWQKPVIRVIVNEAEDRG